MQIRKMLVSDYDTVDFMLKELHQLHVIGYPALYKEIPHIYTKQEYVGLLHNKDNICLVMETEDTIIGFCLVSIKHIKNSCMNEQTMGYIEALYIASPWKNKGLGNMFFSYIEKQLSKLGIQYLNLTVWDFNKDAIKFYSTLGMTPQRHIYTKKLY